jgi:lipopolysaccharide/colanic/teichoic acid biosynthesis glycosyltransferase
MHVPSRRRRLAKRAFDISFAAFGLAVTAPLFPAVMLAIWLEDGGPFFFGHPREKQGGVEFRCWKFRSMRHDAEKLKIELSARNEADGPQFFISNDPRVTRVGRVLRRFNLDELPQFWNVLKGDMAIVGPRPSPRRENQFSPPWREMRLSVRPGITGLWQVCRSRKGGNDFQEWIKYDLEYVERSSLRLDLLIIWRSIHICLRGESRTS